MNTTCSLLESNVENIMTKSPITVEMQDTMASVNEVLNAHGLSCVPVIDPDKQDCFGIVSLKEVSRLKAKKINLQTVRAWEVCTYKPQTVTPDTPIREVLKLMVNQRLHHIVIARNGKIEGFVSTFDVIAACMASQENCATVSEASHRERVKPEHSSLFIGD